MTGEPPKDVPRDVAGRKQQWGTLDYLVADARSEPSIGNAALLRYTTIPAPCYGPPGQKVSSRRLSCRSQRSTRRAGNAGSAGVAARPQCDVLVMAFGPAAGQRQIVLWQGWLS